VLDRFHVVCWFAAGLIEVRRRIQRRDPRGHVTPAFDTPAFDPELFRARFLALRRADRIDEAEAALERFADLYEQDALAEFYKVVDTRRSARLG
jgi:hypothetical protein